MKAVNDEQLQYVKNLMRNTINKLRDNDYDLFDLPDEACVCEFDIDKDKLERKLHEVCINHRFACYLEAEIKKIQPSYYIDIEYNRCYKKAKYVGDDKKIFRPDILVHTRATKLDNVPQHYLIIEAKKEIVSKKDEEKVQAFMMDQNYEYLFGITIKYGDLKPALCKVFYSLNGQDTSCEEFEI
jgi:hypothetical protein